VGRPASERCQDIRPAHQEGVKARAFSFAHDVWTVTRAERDALATSSTA